MNAARIHSPLKAVAASGRDPGMATTRGGGRPLRSADWRPETCQWIEGDARERNFCGKPVKPGSSYCPEHHARCWKAVPKEEGAVE